MSKKIKLVLSGSGCLYPVHVGAVLRLAEAGYEIVEVCGTSGGAIVASAIASGYPLNQELVRLIKNTLPGKNGLIDTSLWSLFKDWGLVKGSKLEELLDKKFIKKFSEAKIPLHVITTNVDSQKICIFSSSKTPLMSVSRAVRASLSVPIVFTPVKIDDNLHVDGGIMANFFLDIFGKGDDVIGLKFKAVADQKGSKTKVKGFIDFLLRIIDSLIQGSTNEHIEDAIFARTILLESKHSGTNYKMTEADADDMIKEGYMAVDAWLSKGHT